MKIASKKIIWAMELAFDMFTKTHEMRSSAHVKASYFAGAALASAAHDGTKETIEALMQIAMDALGGEKP